MAYGLNKPRGALIADILPGSPAAKSDLRSGDIVLEFEERSINYSTDLPPLVGLSAPGTLARFNVFRRDRGMQTVVVTLGELKEETANRTPARRERVDNKSRYGLGLSEITALQRGSFDIDHGVSVTGVDEGPARAAGLRPGDVIMEVDGKRAGDIPGFYRLLDHTPPGKPAVLRVRRGMATLFLAWQHAGPLLP